MWLVLVVWGFESEVVFREKTRFSDGGGGVCSVKWVMCVYL
ncbi:hypothetical protein Hanom_Chr02g00102991 [Helianthus anomalus]